MAWQASRLADGFGPRRVDPYWVWAEITGMRGFALPSGQLDMCFIAQLRRGATLEGFVREARAIGLPLWISPLYVQPLEPERGCPFFTARTDRAGLRMLQALKSLERWEFGAALRSAEGRGDAAPPIAAAPAAAARRRRASALIGIIDDGLAALNEQFVDAARGPRVRLLWDQQGTTTVGGWAPAARQGYGRVIDAAALRAQLAGRAPGEDETAVYGRWQYLLAPDSAANGPGRVLRTTHGTHITHVAAGRTDPALGAMSGDAGDAASRGEIAFVSLPMSTVADSSGGSLPVQVLDALRALLDECLPDAAVAINLSYGCQGGPHDGSSLLELAIDDLIRRRRGRLAVVVSAGNSAQAFTHASQRVAPGRAMTMRWFVPPGDTTDSFVEIWYPKPARAGGITVEVVDPQGNGSGPIGAGTLARVADAAGRVTAALAHVAAANNGDGSMALLALAPTAAPPGARPTPPTTHSGEWQIIVRSNVAVEVHAFIERDDPVPSSNKPLSRFVHLGPQPDPAGSLNGLATGRRSLVAGGCRQSDGQRVPYSSMGPTRNAHKPQGPDVLAACDADEATLGLLAAAVRSAERFRMNGTSVAAPVLTRRVFNFLVQDRGNRIGSDAQRRAALLAVSDPQPRSRQQGLRIRGRR